MWGSICKNNKITEEEYLHRNYFLTDYFFPEYNLAVEIDSDLHEYLGDESVDSAVFCMSLWGTNYLDSIKEAHRYLKTGGNLYVVEPKDKVDQSVLLGETIQLGFDLTNLVLERNGKTYFEYKKIR